MNRKQYGLIGYPLSHSFSKKYFTEKFISEGLTDCHYEIFPLEKIAAFKSLLQSQPLLKGLNVTIPYKEEIIHLLDELAPSAAKTGAVNVIAFEKDGRLIGHNSDIVGFEKSLLSFLEGELGLKALVLGTGGAAKAVQVVLKELDIPFQVVSRNPKAGQLSWSVLNEEIITTHPLIINCTPLGMYPLVEEAPAIPYQWIGRQHFFYDLVYNPEESLFLKKAKEKGALIKNGLEMLYLQAEKAWEIWKASE